MSQELFASIVNTVFQTVISRGVFSFFKYFSSWTLSLFRLQIFYRFAWKKCRYNIIVLQSSPKQRDVL